MAERVSANEFDAVRTAKELLKEYGHFTPEGVRRAFGIRAAEYIFVTLSHDAETLNRFVELIGAADAETFRTTIIELHQRRSGRLLARDRADKKQG